MASKKTPIDRNLKFNSQSGASLLEVIMVVVIVVIVATFTVAHYRSSRAQFDRQNVARQLKVSLERARFDSVKRRTSNASLQAKVIISPSWFSLTTDANNNQVIDTSDTEVTNFGSQNI